MKKVIFYCLIFLIFSCKNESSNSRKAISKDLNLVKDTIVSLEEMTEVEDCIFDQEAQTDEFLKGIKEFENYVWDSETKLATVELSKTEMLKIYRGGCAHFTLSATFEIKNLNLSFPKDKEFIFSKVLWVSQLIKEFHFEKIYNDLELNNFTLENDHNSVFISLNSKEESNLTYSILVSDHSEYSEISIIQDMN
jgi:hypothetical protein